MRYEVTLRGSLTHVLTYTCTYECIYLDAFINANDTRLISIDLFFFFPPLVAAANETNEIGYVQFPSGLTVRTDDQAIAIRCTCL